MENIDWDKVVIFLLALSAAASAFVALTPTPRDDEFIGKLYKWVERLGMVVGKAKEHPPNKVEEGQAPAPPPPPAAPQ